MSYQTEKYAASLAEFGAPLWLPHCRGWVLQREIETSGAFLGALAGRSDAMGCYPLFSCEDWSQFGNDLAVLRSAGLVSLTLVTDPLDTPGPEKLQRWFPQVARAYKEHYLVDLATGPDDLGTAHHRRNVRRFLRRGRIEICDDPVAEAGRWTELYEHLIARHGITGLACFSAASFRQQLAMPGATLLRADTLTGELVGMQIWVNTADKAWYHLGAYNELGYSLGGASAALTSFALNHYRSHGVRWANLGSGAGLSHDADDGLSRFKRGWSTETRWAWLCGVVLDENIGAQVGPMPDTDYFPAYRTPTAASSATQEVAVRANAD